MLPQKRIDYRRPGPPPPPKEAGEWQDREVPFRGNEPPPVPPPPHGPRGDRATS